MLPLHAKNEMELIKQKEFGGCGVACLAMVTGKKYDQILSEIDDIFGRNLQNDGLSDAEIVSYLSEQPGFKSVRSTTTRPDWRPAILTVPSLNYIGLLHYIVWDGERYLDPAIGSKTWPDDAPVLKGKRIISWASAVIWD